MILAQPLLIAISLFLGWFYFSRVQSRLSNRLFLGILLLALVVIILQPSLATEAANALGIGRGTDLLLYLFSLFVLFCLILIYQKLKNIDRINVEIVRALSIMNARPPDSVESVDELEEHNS